MAPTVTPWNPATGDVLKQEMRPKGTEWALCSALTGKNGRALYAPFDRVALAGHPNWRTEYPRRVWDSSKDLTWILQILHEMLNNDDYTGI